MIRRTAGLLTAASLLGVVLAFGASERRSSGTVAGARVESVTPDTIDAIIRRRLAAPGSIGLLSPERVSRYYERRGYAPAWGGETELGRNAEALLRALRGAEAEGLRPEEYRPERIEETLAHPGGAPRGAPLDPGRRATLDLLLTDAFLTYGGHLASGRIDPVRIHAGWSLPARRVDVAAALDRAIGDGRVAAALGELAPRSAEYLALRAALGRYRAIEARGGWAELPSGPTLRPGEQGDAVQRLRTRLAVEMPLAPAASPDVYDPALAEVVRGFQRTHGLVDDAAVGPATRAGLNVGAGRRAEQIALGLERLRWLPDDLGRRYVRVNIPAFELAVVEDGRTALAMRVVGGRPDWRTPIFSAAMRSVVLSPYWNIPPSIAAGEVLPRARRDPSYLSRNGIRWVRDGSGYRLRQDPGPLNPLGGVKFVFPNPYNVYLHDTPSRQLFAEPERAYSHGCMRVEKPLELAEYVLRPLGWDREAIRRAMTGGVERTVTLRSPVPVHVLYQTAWVDTAGRVQFRDDIYGHDRRLARVLRGSGVELTERVTGDCAVPVG